MAAASRLKKPSTEVSLDIGFIGLGHMGGLMARRLLKAGHRVKAFDLSQDAIERMAADGAVATQSAAQAATNVDVIVTMLPAGDHVRDVYLGNGRVLEAAADNTLCIDCSTIDVATAREVTACAYEQGKLMVDAPVSGGMPAAEKGTLTFIVGGQAAAFEKAKPALEAMGRKIIHAGPSGSGQTAKICNNMLLAISMIGTCEAFILAEKLGLDAQSFFDIASNASGQCHAMTSFCPVPGPVPDSPANRNYEAGFTIEMMIKDLQLAQQAARSTGAATPLGGQALSLYSLSAAAGHDGLDFTGIIKLLQGRT